MSRNALIWKSKWAEQAERYDDMADFMKTIVLQHGDTALEVEERNLLSVAYKNVVGARRSSWRVVSSIVEKMETSEGKKLDEHHLQQAKAVLEKIEAELKETCKDVINLLTDHLIPKAHDPEGIVFYLKMKGDYHRYVAEVVRGEERQAVIEEANTAYTEASEKGKKSIPSTNPIRLGLALNFSVFYYEIMNDSNKACELARNAFDEGIKDLDALKECNYKDSTLIMQLLRDNLTLWNDSENQQDEQQELDE